MRKQHPRPSVRLRILEWDMGGSRGSCADARTTLAAGGSSYHILLLQDAEGVDLAQLRRKYWVITNRDHPEGDIGTCLIVAFIKTTFSLRLCPATGTRPRSTTGGHRPICMCAAGLLSAGPVGLCAFAVFGRSVQSHYVIIG